MAKAKKPATKSAEKASKPPKSTGAPSKKKAAGGGGILPLPPGDLRMRPPESGVTVRMYRTGLGDCFLLCFPLKGPKGPGAEARPAFVLIDCGVFKGTKGGAD